MSLTTLLLATEFCQSIGHENKEHLFSVNTTHNVYNFLHVPVVHVHSDRFMEPTI